MLISLVVFFTSVSLAGVITSMEAYDPMSLAGTANTTMYTSLYGGFGMLGGILIIAFAVFILFVFFVYSAKGSM